MKNFDAIGSAYLVNADVPTDAIWTDSPWDGMAWGLLVDGEILIAANDEDMERLAETLDADERVNSYQKVAIVDGTNCERFNHEALAASGRHIDGGDTAIFLFDSVEEAQDACEEAVTIR